MDFLQEFYKICKQLSGGGGGGEGRAKEEVRGIEEAGGFEKWGVRNGEIGERGEEGSR